MDVLTQHASWTSDSICKWRQLELDHKEHTLLEDTRVCVIPGGRGSDPTNTVTKATWDDGETTPSTGKRPGEEPEGTGPRTSPETLAKFFLTSWALVYSSSKWIKQSLPYLPPWPWRGSIKQWMWKCFVNSVVQACGRGWGSEPYFHQWHEWRDREKAQTFREWEGLDPGLGERSNGGINILESQGPRG